LNYFLLLLTAAIWGFAFVAQRLGMQSVDPFSFNAVRFTLGALVVYLVAGRSPKSALAFPWLPGFVLFIAASLQQVGIIFTGAGAAGFITGLYVVIVPLLGLMHKERMRRQDMLASVIALAGMLLINQPGNLRATLGNLLVFVSAFFWAWHVRLIGRYAKIHPTARLAFAQFAICALLSALAAPLWFVFYDMGLSSLTNLGMGLYHAAWPIAYGGLLSVGVAYTLQIKAQKVVAPVPASIILCGEGVFATLGGILILREQLTLLSGLGMALMLIAMLFAVVPELFD